MSISNSVPMAVFCDSYKATHALQYPDCSMLSAYGEFRWGFNKDTGDTRLVHYGIRDILDKYLLRKWTAEELEQAGAFYSTHCALATPLEWPRDLFTRVVTEHGGYFPLKLQALPEGTCTNARVPVYQISTKDDFAPLCTLLETVLTHVWYASTVATLSRRARDVIEAAFEKGADGGADSPLLVSRLHDFGMRGCTTGEQSIIGGCAHLLNFEGTDTMPAAFHAQFHLNGGKPVGFSIPASEHSVMTAWSTERKAILNMISHFGDGLFAIVMDSYDYARALAQVLPSIKEEKVGRGGFMVLRPDSGDPVEAVIQALEAADVVFGHTVNTKGYKVLNGCGVIQGDGIDIDILRNISDAVLAAGYSPDNVAYGMGAGLLQKVNRDTMGFATKLNLIRLADGSERAVMKCPKTDSSKISFPGRLAVKAVNGVPTVFPEECVADEDNMLRTIYDCGPVPVEWETFDEVRERVKRTWKALPPKHAPLSAELKAKIASVTAKLRADGESAQDIIA